MRDNRTDENEENLERWRDPFIRNWIEILSSGWRGYLSYRKETTRPDVESFNGRGEGSKRFSLDG